VSHRACQAPLTRSQLEIPRGTAKPSCSKTKRKTIHAQELASDPNTDRETLICEKRAYRQILQEDGGTETRDGEITGLIWLPMMPHVQTAFSHGLSAPPNVARSWLRVRPASDRAHSISAPRSSNICARPLRISGVLLLLDSVKRCDRNHIRPLLVVPAHPLGEVTARKHITGRKPSIRL